MFIFYIISYITIILIILRITKDYLSPIIFILAEQGVKILLPITFSNTMLSQSVFDMHLNVSLHLHLFGLFSSFYVFSYFGSKLKINRKCNGTRVSAVPMNIILFFVLASCISFVAIFIFGQFELLDWLKNPRKGYLFGRKGVGMFYVSFIFFLNLAWITLLVSWSTITTLKKLLLFSLVIYLAYLSGSKRVFVSLFLFSAVLYNLYVKRFTILQLLTVFILLGGIFTLYFLLGTGNLQDLSGYFSYFDTSLRIYKMLLLGDLEHQWGAINATRIWEFIPRYFYPDKPFVYGGGYVTELLAPGQAEKGHNLGMLDFTVYYLDFNQLGVLYHGVVRGAFAGFIYAMFKKNQSSFFLLLIYLSLFTNVMPTTPKLLFLVIVFFLFMIKMFYTQVIKQPLSYRAS